MGVAGNIRASRAAIGNESGVVTSVLEMSKMCGSALETIGELQKNEEKCSILLHNVLASKPLQCDLVMKYTYNGETKLLHHQE